MQGIAILLAVTAFFVASVGLAFASQAALGAAVVAAGGVLAIFARLAQASHHTRQLLRAQERLIQIAMNPMTAAPRVVPPAWQCSQCGQNNGLDVFACARCNADRSVYAT